jgi:hypothetical protein
VRSRWIIPTIWLAVALHGIFAAAGARGEPAAPALAIISRHRDPEVAQLLFSRLAAGRDFRLRASAENPQIAEPTLRFAGKAV